MGSTALVVSLVAPMSRAAARTDTAARGARVAAPEQVDLGAQPFGPRIVPGSFYIRNAGIEPLEVRNLRSSCLCMTVEPSSVRLAPGESAQLKIALDLGYREGRYVHPVLIYSNDPVRPVAKVNVQVDVPTFVGWSPKANILGLVHKGPELATRRFDLFIGAKDKRPLEPPRVRSTSPYVRAAEIVPYQDGAHRVKLAVDPAIPVGEYSEWLEVDTHHPQQPTLRFPLRWAVTSDLVTPRGVDMGLLPEGKAASGKFMVQNLGTRPVTVLKAEARLPVPAAVRVEAKEKGFEVSVSLPNPPPPWRFEGEIALHTDHPEQPLLRIPVMGKTAAAQPFERVAADGGDDAGLYAVLADALYDNERISMPEVLQRVLGGVRDDRAVSLLMRALTQSELFPVRMRAAEALGELRSPRAVEALTRAVTDDLDNDVRRFAAMALAKIIGREAQPVLLLALQDDDDWVREDAALLLKDVGDARAVPALREALGDPEADVRKAAQAALDALQEGGE